MAIISTLWSPDVCECVLVYTVDDSVAQDVQYASVLRTCPAHVGLSGVTLFRTVVEECRRKEAARTFALDTNELATVLFDWSFAADRTLLVTTFNVFGAFTAAEKTLLQSRCDLRFGPGKVVVS